MPALFALMFFVSIAAVLIVEDEGEDDNELVRGG
jgi:hypothetical protein